ncbi:MAG TPA: hypothetical protein PKH94_09835 [Bacteroidales bacterium]|nr:hypothetical protein [Bacteroidales bacterium]HNS47529.1 hypothetical protein [Bacteroidales bacterium]
MKTLSVFKTGLTVLVMGLLLSLPFSVYSQEIIDIQVSPSTLNLQNQGEWVTVHTDIAYGLVLESSVTLNGIAIEWSKVDNQGNFVAKFVIGSIIGIPGLNIGDYNTLTLEGVKTIGGTFTGSDEVMVINPIPKKK